MALQNETSKIQYNGNNSTTTSYAVPFYFFDNAHIKAIVTNSSGVDSILSLGSGFALTGAGNVTGGTLTTTAAVPSSSKVTIYREVPATQLTSYAEGGDFPAASHERALDKLTMLAQQMLRSFGRALKFPESVTGVSADLPKPQANNVIGWTAAATGLQNYDFGRVSTLETTTATHSTQISGLTTRMTAAEQDITILETGLANTNDAVDQLNTIVDGYSEFSSVLTFPADMGLITESFLSQTYNLGNI
jgi:hypothetical protein